MTMLVLGRRGQVARHISERRPGAIFWGREELDLADLAAIDRRIRATAPSLIVNAAAYTSVDRAESEASAAWRLNCEAPAAVARTAAELGIPFLHISTDYVFDGRSSRDYEPDDPVRPLNVYGRSKLCGELAVTDANPRHWILRTSWVFSEYGSNFVSTMLRLARERDELRVVADQFGRPTYAGDLADVLLALAESVEAGRAPASGIYHVGGGAVVSWYDFAVEIVSRAQGLGLLKRAPGMVPIRTADYPTPARRPLRAVLAPSEEFQRALGWTPDWISGLDRVLRHRNPPT